MRPAKKYVHHSHSILYSAGFARIYILYYIVMLWQVLWLQAKELENAGEAQSCIRVLQKCLTVTEEGQLEEEADLAKNLLGLIYFSQARHLNILTKLAGCSHLAYSKALCSIMRMGSPSHLSHVCDS